MSRLDHIEVHVSDIQLYCLFLKNIFEGGTFEIISQSGTSMFTSPEGINIEVKKMKTSGDPSLRGFCNPCLRRTDPEALLLNQNMEIVSEQDTPSGKVYFFKDHEGITWHIKDLPE